MDAAQLADLTAEALMRKRAVIATRAGYDAQGGCRCEVTLADGSRWRLAVSQLAPADTDRQPAP
jgi:hypothetical protein